MGTFGSLIATESEIVDVESKFLNTWNQPIQKEKGGDPTEKCLLDYKVADLCEHNLLVRCIFTCEIRYLDGLVNNLHYVMSTLRMRFCFQISFPFLFL